MQEHSQKITDSELAPQGHRAGKAWTLAAAVAAALLANAAYAQNYPVTPQQRSTAQQVAQAGVPLSELAPNAPDQYTVKRGDTLWGISGVFLKSPWRWPELWGMNLQEISNPHLIYPGQMLVLEKIDGRARLRVAGGDSDPGTVRVSPRTRVEPIGDASVPTLKSHLIEAFLAEPLIVEESVLNLAPRIVAVPENKVLITRGDRAYARGPSAAPLMPTTTSRNDAYRVFRNAKPLLDPVTRGVLGWEAQYVGKASLVRGESVQAGAQPVGWFNWTGNPNTVVPATIDIVSAKEEIRVGDRLLPEPPRQFTNYVPHAPAAALAGSIVSVYGDAVSIAGQNQVVVIDKGLADGVDNGTVMAILKSGRAGVDRTQPGEHANMQLPDERNGLLMVFRPFDKLSYALILEINDAVQVGDRVINPK
ncbi:LysM peptidoglycan-binding domain-containing protein [Ramlibacter solisilvae]|uniref:Peptidoglycan-binding protein n=1 Tax=Ramlibacter tataouinensis TaxID=94132 RepID=A0A127JSZ7_9BURK|nr:LysM domain-containing protein [Ramlibacter tataouinensis]AMO23094.1 peptidoglycan-binding protein [Ramlibacter tataouinensis]